MAGISEKLPKSQPVSFAEYWVRKRGLPQRDIATFSNQQVTRYAQHARDLFFERQDLRKELSKQKGPTSKQNDECVQSPQSESRGKTFAEMIALIRSGKARELLKHLHTLPESESRDLADRSRDRIATIESRLDKTLSISSVYNRYQEGYHREVEAVRKAEEVLLLRQAAEQLTHTTERMIRRAQMGGESLTSVERDMIDEHQHLKLESIRRQRDLLIDPEVFDQVRIKELEEYKKQLAQEDSFAVTPSRKKYAQKIIQKMVDGKNVLLMGETGTGKTELGKFVSVALIGIKPERVAGHQELTNYDLQGRIGLDVQEGDVHRPAAFPRAMTARGGRGKPLLFDELDRAPIQVLFGVKHLLGVKPGETGVQIRTDSDKTIDVGPDYALIGAANIKSDKYTTATDLDPAIIREFDAPMEIDYMPVHELYDLALASLIDERGNLPLGEKDAQTTLKHFCDAVQATQNMYQGKKVFVGLGEDNYIQEEGGAATGKVAKLEKAILDPGTALGMLKGWTTASINGVSFDEHLSQQIIDFINNRAYPVNDRRHLAEIFVLKGFLKGHQATELLVPGLKQETLDAWIGSADQDVEKHQHTFLPPEKVARLDPYYQLKPPVREEAQELLERIVLTQEAKEKEQLIDIVMDVSDKLTEFFESDAIEFPDPSEDVMRFLDRAKRQGFSKPEAVFLPDIVLDENARYPGWRQKLPPTYYDFIRQRLLPQDAIYLPGEWAVIDATPKPDRHPDKPDLYKDDFMDGLLKRLRSEKLINRYSVLPGSRFNIEARHVETYVLPALTQELDISQAAVVLPTAAQFNFIVNAYHPEWGKTNTDEWLRDSAGDGNRLVGGRVRADGYFNIEARKNDFRFSEVGFRPMIVFKNEK